MKKILAVILSAAMVLSMAACSSSSSNTQQSNDDSSTNTAEATGDLENFDIVLDWYPNAVHSFIYVAMEKGYYEEEGLKVNVQFPSNTNDAISLTAAGKADAGLYYQPNIISVAANQNIPIKVLGTVVQHPLNVVMSLKESNINGAKDLAGKVVGYPGTTDNEFFIKAMMEHNGLSYDDVTMQDVGFDLNTALITGNVDAVIGTYINHEYPTLLQEGYDVTYFNITDEGVPDYEELVLITGEDQVKNESDKLERFIRASKKGFEDVLADPQAALDILLKNQDEANYPLDPNVEQASMEILLPLMTSDKHGFLEINKDSWTEDIDWLKEQGLLEGEITADDLIANLE